MKNAASCSCALRMCLQLLACLMLCAVLPSPLYGAGKSSKKVKGQGDVNTFRDYNGILMAPSDPDALLEKLQKNIETTHKIFEGAKTAFDSFKGDETVYFITLERTTFMNKQGSGFLYLEPYIVFPGTSEGNYFVNGKTCTLNPKTKSFARLDSFYSSMSQKLKKVSDSMGSELEKKLEQQKNDLDSISNKLIEAQKQPQATTYNVKGVVKVPQQQPQQQDNSGIIAELMKSQKDAKKKLKETEEDYKAFKDSCSFTEKFLETMKKQYELYGISVPDLQKDGASDSVP